MKYKKLTCFILIVLCFLFVPILGGCSNNMQTKTTVFPENSIGNLTIFAQNNVKDSLPMLFNLGHSFLTFENTSGVPQKIASYTVLPNETICLGTWSISSHFGVWFNLEYNYHSIFNRYEGRVSVTKGITEQNLQTITEFIYLNDTWSPIKNCSYFAVNLWNKIAEDEEKLDTYWIYSPSKVMQNLKQFKNYEVNKPMQSNKVFGYFSNSTYVSFTMQGDYEYV